MSAGKFALILVLIAAIATPVVAVLMIYDKQIDSALNYLKNARAGKPVTKFWERFIATPEPEFDKDDGFWIVLLKLAILPLITWIAVAAVFGGYYLVCISKV